jgi:carbon storage regulator
MLVLTRHLDEVIRIGEKIKLKILKIESNNVKIGIEAPEDVLVFRDEIYERIKEENIKASKIDHTSVKDIAQRVQKKIKQGNLK